MVSIRLVKSARGKNVMETKLKGVPHDKIIHDLWKVVLRMETPKQGWTPFGVYII